MTRRLTRAARSMLEQIAIAGVLAESEGQLIAPDGLPIAVPEGWLEELPPPIPAEPEPGAYLIGLFIAVGVGDERWDVPSLTTGDKRMSWAQVWEAIGGPGVTFARLVPEEPTEPITLPLDIAAMCAGDLGAKESLVIEEPNWGAAVSAGAIAYIGLGDPCYLNAEQVDQAIAALRQLRAPRSDARDRVNADRADSGGA